MFMMPKVFFLLSLLVLQSIRYKSISDWGVYTIPYSLPTTLTIVLKSYRIHHRLRVNGRLKRYKQVTESNKSDTV